MATSDDASVDRRLSLMGTHIRLLIGPRARNDVPEPALVADRVEEFLRMYDRTLSRFKPESELCALNSDRRTSVPASDLLCSAIRAALEAAELSGGLVDPTVLEDLEDAGYRESWDTARRLELRAALRESPAPRRPAQARRDRRWRQIDVDGRTGTITRPPGLRVDTGGTGKGHAAELAGAMLSGYEHWAVDCGGDVRIGGDSGVTRKVEVEDPFSGEMLPGFEVRRGAVATSGLRSRIWRGADGVIAHHLLDPATGLPAFTGLVAVTALAPTAVEAEARAKAALLGGRQAAARALSHYGGITFDEDGHAQRIGRLEPAPLVRLRVPRRSPA